MALRYSLLGRVRIVNGVFRFPNLLILPFFKSAQNQSPFPPSAFTDFRGTMGSSDSRQGKDSFCPLEVDVPPPRRVSHVPNHSFPTCRRHYPGEMTSRCRSYDEVIPVFPQPTSGSTLSFVISRIAQRLLTLRPAGLQPALCRLLSRQLRRVGCPSRRDDSYQDGSTASWVGLPPTGMVQLLMTHGRLPHPPFRGLLSVHSHYGLHAR